MLVALAVVCAEDVDKKQNNKRGVFGEFVPGANQLIEPFPAYPSQPILPLQHYPSFYQPNAVTQLQPIIDAPTAAIQTEPEHVQTIIKKLAVPYERHIHIDNPIYTPVERPVPIDNPVPIIKYVEQPVPIHVDHPITVPIIKEVQVPQPYVQKVRLVFQKVFVQQPPAPQPQKTIIVSESHQHGYNYHNAGWN